MATTARAFVDLVEDDPAFGFDYSGNFTYTINVRYFPQGSGQNLLTGLKVATLTSDTATIVLQKITTAVVNAGAELGYTVARSAVLIPGYQKGQ